MPGDVTFATYVDRLLAGRRWSAQSRAELTQIVAGTADVFPTDWQPRVDTAWGQAQESLSTYEHAVAFEQPSEERRMLHVVRGTLETIAVSWPMQTASPDPKPLQRNDAPAIQSESSLKPQQRLAALIAAQGVQPVRDIAELAFPEWPADESADDLISAVRAWREGRETPSRP
jgi:hypothetical protein